jgi:putative PIN family toxin of toxin-antitoxin system
MRRVVLDTNCLLQALPTRSPYHKIWIEVLAGHISLCVNSDILNEYEEILAEKTTHEIAHNVVEAIARMHTTVFQEVYIHFGLIEADADDNKFVDCAVAADAEYIVTNDTHFNILKQIDWPRLTVINIKEFTSQLDDYSETERTKSLFEG